MAIMRQSVKVMRFWHRMSGWKEVIALPFAARWWLYGVTMAWTGEDNGVIQFTRRSHGAKYGLEDRKVFERARQDVLATGLVEMTRAGGRNLPALYFLTCAPKQAAPPILGGLQPPTDAAFPSEILGGRQPPVAKKTGGRQPPNRGSTTPKDFDLHIKNARASDLESEKTKIETHSVTNTVTAVGSNEEAPNEAAATPNGVVATAPYDYRAANPEVCQREEGKADPAVSAHRTNGVNPHLVSRIS